MSEGEENLGIALGDEKVKYYICHCHFLADWAGI